MQEFSLDALGLFMDLETAGGEPALADGKLRVASVGLTPALRHRIRQHRDELIGLVQLAEAAASPAELTVRGQEAKVATSRQSTPPSSQPTSDYSSADPEAAS